MAAINALKSETRAKNLRAEKEQMNEKCEAKWQHLIDLYVRSM